DLLFEVGSACPQRLVGQRLELLLQGVDLGDARLIAANPPFVGGAKQLAGDGADHSESSSTIPQRPKRLLPALRKTALFGQIGRQSACKSLSSRGHEGNRRGSV